MYSCWSRNTGEDARFHEQLDADTTRTVLTGYRNRYSLIRDAMAETNTEFSDDHLTQVSLLMLLTQPVLVVADRLAGALGRP